MFFPVMRFNAIKWEQEGAVTRKYDAAREKGGDNFKKSDFKHKIATMIKTDICILSSIILTFWSQL